mmetsp:Transcript_743/g.1923  ORF Transcript_743/g.1923 Transcript_743/m.1923 type:complete len:294 (-) Transcript_743:390-1271(-)
MSRARTALSPSGCATHPIWHAHAQISALSASHVQAPLSCGHAWRGNRRRGIAARRRHGCRAPRLPGHTCPALRICRRRGGCQRSARLLPTSESTRGACTLVRRALLSTPSSSPSAPDPPPTHPTASRPSVFASRPHDTARICCLVARGAHPSPIIWRITCPPRDHMSTSRIQPYKSSCSPYWMPCRVSRSCCSTSNFPNSCLVSPSVMLAIGTHTVAVPHAPTSLKLDTSSHASDRSCTSIPYLPPAICISILLVMLGRIDDVLGVTYAPLPSMPTKLETENSSTYLCSTQSR